MVKYTILLSIHADRRIYERGTGLWAYFTSIDLPLNDKQMLGEFCFRMGFDTYQNCICILPICVGDSISNRCIAAPLQSLFKIIDQTHYLCILSYGAETAVSSRLDIPSFDISATRIKSLKTTTNKQTSEHTVNHQQLNYSHNHGYTPDQANPYGCLSRRGNSPGLLLHTTLCSADTQGKASDTRLRQFFNLSL